MTVFMSTIATLGTALAAFLALSLAMDRHYENSYGRGRNVGVHRLWLRSVGTLGLILSLTTSLHLYGRSQGWVFWLGILTAAAIMTMLVLSYAPRRAALTGMVGGVTGLLALVAALMLKI